MKCSNCGTQLELTSDKHYVCPNCGEHYYDVTECFHDSDNGKIVERDNWSILKKYISEMNDYNRKNSYSNGFAPKPYWFVQKLMELIENGKDNNIYPDNCVWKVRGMTDEDGNDMSILNL